MTDEGPSPGRSTLEESRERLRQRKKRMTTACWPCRLRKVKCDRSHPCDTCSKREHAELCTYEGPSPTKRNSSAHLGSPPRQSSTSRISGSGRFPALPSSPLTSVNDLGPSVTQIGNALHIDNHIDRSTGPLRGDAREPFLGEDSTPSFIRDQTSAGDTSGRRTNVERALMPILGLNETSGSYPFLPVMANESNMHEALPSDRDINRFFQCFRTQLQVFTPILSDIDGFEAKLCRYIDYRSRQRGKDPPPVTETFSCAWMSLVYAVISSGVQFSDMPHDQRSALSQKYSRYAFQCLRLANFLFRPTLECLQTFLVLGNVLQNAMRPDAAWILMGITARVSQSLGLHQAHEVQDASSSGRRLWLAVIWQDSLLSLCFDRPSATMITLTSSAFSSSCSDNANKLSYTEAMYALMLCTLRGLKVKEISTTDFEGISTAISDIERIYDAVDVHLKHAENCTTFQQRCEYYALRLHTSFAAAWLSRGAFRQISIAESQLQTRASLIATGKKYLIESLKAYLQLKPLCLQASRSWAFIHNGLSSALLLGLIGETKVNPEVRELQGALIDAFSAGASESNPEMGLGQDLILGKLHERALTALKNLYNDQSPLPRPASALPRPITRNAESSEDLNGNVISSTEPYAYPETFPYDMVPSGFQQPVDMTGMPGAHKLSPMEIFDSMMWDPSFTSDDFLGLDMNAGPWMF